MVGKLHFEAPTVLQYFAALVADDASLSMLEAAVAVAQDADPGLDPQAALAEVDALAAALRRRIPADAGPLHRLRLLNRYFFAELGFAGNVNDYYDPANSYLPAVLARRRGIPITLAILYIELAGQAGLRAVGVSFPGHFLVKLHMPQGEVVIDPFNGQSLSREELDERLAPFRRRQGAVDDEEEVPLGLYLQAAPARDVIARLLRNLKEIHRSAGQLPRLLAVLERLVILLPDHWEERRDRGLVRAELGRTDLACADIEAYLAARADAPGVRRRHRACTEGTGMTTPTPAMRQLPLPLAREPLPTFDNFVPGENAAVLAHLRALAMPAAPVYLWGPPGSGKTHLLGALVHAVQARGQRAASFDRRESWGAALAPDAALVVIDDCDALDDAAQADAFRLFVDAATQGTQIIAAGRVPPVDLPLREDLRTRLGWGPVFALQPLADALARAALRREADRRGILLSDEVMDHLLTRFARDLKHLMQLLDRLDRFALARSRTVTVPLLKQMLDEEGAA